MELDPFQVRIWQGEVAAFFEPELPLRLFVEPMAGWFCRGAGVVATQIATVLARNARPGMLKPALEGWAAAHAPEVREQKRWKDAIASIELGHGFDAVVSDFIVCRWMIVEPNSPQSFTPFFPQAMLDLVDRLQRRGALLPPSWEKPLGLLRGYFPEAG